MAKDRVESIHFLRALSATLVVVFHACNFVIVLTLADGTIALVCETGMKV